MLLFSLEWIWAESVSLNYYQFFCRWPKKSDGLYSVKSFRMPTCSVVLFDRWPTLSDPLAQVTITSEFCFLHQTAVVWFLFLSYHWHVYDVLVVIDRRACYSASLFPWMVPLTEVHGFMDFQCCPERKTLFCSFTPLVFFVILSRIHHEYTSAMTPHSALSNFKEKKKRWREPLDVKTCSCNELQRLQTTCFLFVWLSH